jgi:hypothetical protein
MILRFKPGRLIQYSHFSPISGLPAKPENYHIVTIELSGKGNQTRVSLAQDNNPTEQARSFRKKFGDDACRSEKVIGGIELP